MPNSEKQQPDHHHGLSGGIDLEEIAYRGFYHPPSLSEADVKVACAALALQFSSAARVLAGASKDIPKS